MIIQGSQEWHNQRAFRLTASDFAAAIGASPYKSRIQLWKEKTGKVNKEPSNWYMEYGLTHEPIARRMFEDELGVIVENGGFHIHPEHSWLAASPDGLIDDNAILEIKCVSTKPDPILIPIHYFPQVIGQLACTGRDFCYFVRYFEGELTVNRIDFDHKFWKWMVGRLSNFWTYVISDEQPPRLKRKPEFSLENDN